MAQGYLSMAAKWVKRKSGKKENKNSGHYCRTVTNCPILKRTPRKVSRGPQCFLSGKGFYFFDERWITTDPAIKFAQIMRTSAFESG
jgi:hypothetical protein